MLARRSGGAFVAGASAACADSTAKPQAKENAISDARKRRDRQIMCRFEWAGPKGCSWPASVALITEETFLQLVAGVFEFLALWRELFQFLGITLGQD